jgi:two-component system, chemotaxis family, sensor kinase CheA
VSSDEALAQFIDEAEQWARDLAAALEDLRTEPGSPDPVKRAFQSTHNYKNSATLGFTRMPALAHRMEDVLTPVRNRTAVVAPGLVGALVSGADLLAEMVAAIARGEGEAAVDAAAAMEELGAWAPRTIDAPATPPPAGSAPAADAPPDAGVLAGFLPEAEDLSQRLSEQVIALVPGAGAAGAIGDLFRTAHSLEGAAGMARCSHLRRLVHDMGNVLHRVHDGVQEVTPGVRDAMLEGADGVAELVAALGRGEPETSVDTTAAIDALAAVAPSPDFPVGSAPAIPRPALTEQGFGASERARVREAGDRGETLFRLTCELDPAEQMRFARAYLLYAGLEDAVNVVAVDPPMDPSAVEPDEQGSTPDDRAYANVTVWFTSAGDGSEALAAAAGAGTVKVERLEAGALPAFAPAAAPAAEPGRRAAVERTTIRVDTRKLDALWAMVAELVQAKARVGVVAERMGRDDDAEGLRSGLGEALDSLDKISGGMQQAMMETRMIPIRVIFEKFPRMVRDLSRKLHKSIDLELAGEDTEIDRGIVEALADPLQHLLRNAAGHGIEFPEDRVRVGKPEQGRIRVAASQQGGRIVIEVSDDGRGIDLDAVRAKAVAVGIAGAADLDERGLLELIFLPGFTTKREADDIAGRGVGMDVVATSIRSHLKGEVLLSSRQGAGTHITLLLPLTLTIMRALLIRGESHVFAVPLAGVETTTRILNTEIRGAGEHLSCVWQDAEIPLFTLGGLLGRPSRRAEELAAVVVRRGGSRACLVVDELLEERELVIKPLDDLANHRRLFSGVSVREDGTLVFILDTSFVPLGS